MSCKGLLFLLNLGIIRQIAVVVASACTTRFQKIDDLYRCRQKVPLLPFTSGWQTFIEGFFLLTLPVYTFVPREIFLIFVVFYLFTRGKLFVWKNLSKEHLNSTGCPALRCYASKAVDSTRRANVIRVRFRCMTQGTEIFNQNLCRSLCTISKQSRQGFYESGLCSK